jgi:hypothetical protein
MHGDRYDYSHVDYQGNSGKVTIICPEHGEFQQIASEHLIGSGCRICGHELAAAKRQLSTEDWVARARIVHEDRYDYSLVDYKGAVSKVRIVCPEHGEFLQSAQGHLAGKGCQRCATYGFDPSRPAVLYYLAVRGNEEQWLYKIGITNFSVSQRFSGTDLNRIVTLKEWSFESGYEAVEREFEILKKYERYKYFGSDVLKKGGNTELFVIDVLGLDEPERKNETLSLF